MSVTSPTTDLNNAPQRKPTGEQEQIAAFLAVPDPAPLVTWLDYVSPDRTLSKGLLKMALPVVFGMVTQTAINMLDTLMVGHLPKSEANPGQAAIGIALPFMWLVGGFLSALWVGTQAQVSRRAGEGNSKAAGVVLTNALLIAGLSSLLFSVLAVMATPPIISFLYDDPAVVAYSTEYLQIRYFGVFAMVGAVVYKSFFDGIGKTHVFMVAAVIMNLFNVVLNYMMIFGYPSLSIPRLGVAGAAWASVIAAMFGLVILVVWSLKPTFFKRYHYYNVKNISFNTCKRILTLSWPNGAATIFVMVGFSAFYWVVGQVSDAYSDAGNPIIATANQLVVTALMPTFMTSFAFGAATAAVVGQALGAGRLALAKRYGWEAIKSWSYAMSVMGIGLFLCPDSVLGWFTADTEVIHLARFPLQMIGLAHGAVAVAVVMAQTLHGVGSARFVMTVEGVLHFLVMSPLAYLCGVVFGWGLIGIWVAPLFYVCALAALTVWKFHSGTWAHEKL